MFLCSNIWEFIWNTPALLIFYTIHTLNSKYNSRLTHLLHKLKMSLRSACLHNERARPAPLSKPRTTVHAHSLHLQSFVCMCRCSTTCTGIRYLAKTTSWICTKQGCPEKFELNIYLYNKSTTTNTFCCVLSANLEKRLVQLYRVASTYDNCTWNTII